MEDAILNSGMPAPIDVQVNTRTRSDLRHGPDSGAPHPPTARRRQIYIPQDMNYPSVRLDVDRVHAAELGLSQQDVVDNVITALNSNVMIAPNYWVDYDNFRREREREREREEEEEERERESGGGGGRGREGREREERDVVGERERW